MVAPRIKMHWIRLSIPSGYDAPKRPKYRFEPQDERPIEPNFRPLFSFHKIPTKIWIWLASRPDEDDKTFDLAFDYLVTCLSTKGPIPLWHRLIGSPVRHHNVPRILAVGSIGMLLPKRSLPFPRTLPQIQLDLGNRNDPTTPATNPTI